MQDVLLLRHSDTGNPRGAFIEFSGADELEKALEYDTEVGRPADTAAVLLHCGRNHCELVPSVSSGVCP